MNQMNLIPANGLTLNDNRLLIFDALIDGKWVGADQGRTFDVTNPADGKIIGAVPDMGGDETRRAIAAAAKALPDWRARTAADRGAILKRWAALLLANEQDLARIMTAEQGKPLGEALIEIRSAAAYIEWFAEEGRRAYGETIPSPHSDRRIVVMPQPVGVCAAITPWNFPAGMIARKAGPALAAGCTMVVKPAEATPFTALAMAWLGTKAGLPAGTLAVITGDPAVIGEVLTSDATVRKLSFTGSTAVGRRLMGQCAPTVKRLSLELGGNAPFIVLDDADLDAAVAGAVASKYRNAGQTCVSANRFYVQDGVHDAFAAKLAVATAQLQVGRGEKDGVLIGPLIDARAVTKVESLVGDALDHGARLVTGGGRHPAGDNFYTPTVLADVSPAMRLAREEIFGPVAALVRFSADEDAITMANDTEYGLAAYVYGRDLSRVWKLAEALEYGMVGINAGVITTEVAPFGGIKQSGIGREGSRHGLNEYLELKYLALALL